MPFGDPPVDEAGEPIRSPRGQSPGGFSGGGSGGGIFGLGGAGFAGFAPNGFGTTGFGSQDARKRRFYAQAGAASQFGQGFNGSAVSTSPVAGYANGGSVAPSDTVPAMLTPGEFVVNRNAASQPGNAAELERMNGGPGGGMPAGGGMGQPQGLSREALIELLQVLMGGEGGYCSGGRVDGYSLGGWIKHHPLGAIGALAAIATAPLWAPAAAGALGIGGAAGAGGAAGGAGAAGAGAAGASTAVGLGGEALPFAASAPMATPGFLAAHAGTIATAARLAPYGLAAYGAGSRLGEGHRLNLERQEAESEAANNQYLNRRALSEQETRGYAAGGSVGMPSWAGGIRGLWHHPGGFPRPGGPPAVGPPAAGPPAPGQPGGSPWDLPQSINGMGAMSEAATRDANDYASGVGRQAQLADVDPGAQAAYRLRALASAGRGAADRLGGYRAEMAKMQEQQAFDLEKQKRDFDYQQQLKRIH